jgi:hypothetical protein
MVCSDEALGSVWEHLRENHKTADKTQTVDTKRKKPPNALASLKA